MAEPLCVIHVVLSLDIGGLERVVVDLAREGRRRGQRVAVICLERPGPLAAEAEAAGVRIDCIHKRPGVRWNTVSALRSIVRDVQPDVVHTHQTGALFYAGLACGRELKPVHTEHGRHPNRRMRTRLLARVAGRYAARFCCVSREIADEAVAKRVVPRRKVHMVPNGVAVERFRSTGRRDVLRRAMGIPDGTLVIGTVGRLVEVKQQDVLLRAVARLRQCGDNPHLLLVGDGPKRDELQRLAAELDLAARTHFVGHQTEPEHYLSAMDVFALTSRSEGMPVAVLEAWAAGMPVAASCVGGLPDLIDHDRTGLLVPAGDLDGWANSLHGLLADPERARRLGNAGRHRVEERYTLGHMVDEYERIYAEALRGCRVAR